MAPETTMTEAADTFGNAPGFSRIAARQPDELPDTPLLGVEVVARKTVRVAFSGELDMASTPQAKHVLTAAGSVGREEVEVDLEDLSFCDAAGLRVFEEARQHCAENGGLLVLTDPRPLLRHVLAITGLTHLLLDR